MPKQNQTPDHDVDQTRKQKQVESQPAPALEQTGLEIPAMPLGATADMAGQANTLNNARLPLLQRQGMASQIGQIGGNAYLQRVIGQMKQDKKQTQSQSPQIGPMHLTETSLPNGQKQQTTRIPFTQVIARSETDETEMEGEGMEQEEPIFIDEVLGVEEIDSIDEDSLSTTLDYESTD